MLYEIILSIIAVVSVQPEAVELAVVQEAFLEKPDTETLSRHTH